jgi:hypothetical protein
MWSNFYEKYRTLNIVILKGKNHSQKMLSYSMTSLGFYPDNHVNGQIHVILRYNLPKMGIKLHIGIPSNIQLNFPNFVTKIWFSIY